VQLICDPTGLMRLYNQAAADSGRHGGAAMPTWPAGLLDSLRSNH